MSPPKYPALIEMLGGYIREHGFRQRALGFSKNGGGRDCLQVVTIQRGASSLLGTFTVELGVFLPSIQPLVWPTLKAPKFPQAYQCSIRERLASIAGLKDTWWKSDDPRAFSEIKSIFDRHGWHFLDQWDGMARIVEKLKAKSNYGPGKNCGSFDAIAILHVAGHTESAHSMLQDAYDDLQGRNISTGSVLDFANRLNITLSTP